MITLSLALALSMSALCGCGGGDAAQPDGQSGQDEEQNLVFSDPELQFQLTRALGDTAYGGADIGECLSTAWRKIEGDVDSWYEEWYATAERLRGIAEESIACSTLILDSDDDTGMKGEPQKLYDALTCPKDFILFTADEGAGLHCQMGAMLLAHQGILDWLDGVFDMP